MTAQVHALPHAATERRKLSPAVVAKLQPRLHSYFVQDAHDPSFGVKVYPNGKKVWITNRWVKGAGRMRRITHGDTRTINHKTAYRLHLAAVGQLASGIDIVENRKLQTASKLTWSQAFAQYVSDKQKAGKLRDSTVRLYRSLLDGPGAKLRDTAIAAIDGAKMKQWYLGLSERQAQANQTLRLWRALWNYAQAVELLPPQPDPTLSITKAGLKYADKVRERQLPPEALGHFALTACMAHTDGLYSAATRDACLMLLATGWRKENVLGLRWEQVDLKQGAIVLEKTKTVPQVIPLTYFTAALLKRRLPKAGTEPKGYVFPSPKDKKTALRNIRPALAHISKTMGLDWTISPQSLRKSVATLLGYLGYPQHIVKALLGHSVGNDVTLAYYQRLHVGPLRAALEDAHRYVSRTMPTEEGQTYNEAALTFMACGAGVLEGVESLADVINLPEEGE